MDHTHIEALLTTIFAGIDGLKISNDARNALDHYSIAHSYGEAYFPNFFRAMTMIIKPNDRTFYDLGSGLGKKVLAAALMHPFETCTGIEILKPMITESQKAMVRLYDNEPSVKHVSIRFIHADYYDIDWSDGNIIFISIMPQILEAQLHGKLLQKLLTLSHGTRIITSHMQIPSSHFEYITTIDDPIHKGAIGELHIHMKK